MADKEKSEDIGGTDEKKDNAVSSDEVGNDILDDKVDNDKSNDKQESVSQGITKESNGLSEDTQESKVSTENKEKVSSETAAEIDVTADYKVPVKELSHPGDITKWENSEAYRDLLGFIMAINDAIKGKKMSSEYPVSERIQKLMEMLEKLDTWISEIPPIDQPQRFGNKAFRDFYKRLKENSETLVQECTGDKLKACIPEISVYLVESVGNDTRIDYGSGHELAFLAFLCCLFKVGALVEEDAVAVALKVFERYLHLMRRLQTVYRMEPAGSHGVWSLDDYQFIPFLWGSSQFIGQRRIMPKSFVKPDIYENFDKEYMFLGCIKYINQVKTGLFAEHSNQLWNISGVASWEKVNSGFIKMYKAEVLAKFPVIQHFLFGSLLSIKQAT